MIRLIYRFQYGMFAERLFRRRRCEARELRSMQFELIRLGCRL